MHPEFGTRFAEYYRRLVGTPWLGHFLKLELIRQAAIPVLGPLERPSIHAASVRRACLWRRGARRCTGERLASDSGRA